MKLKKSYLYIFISIVLLVIILVLLPFVPGRKEVISSAHPDTVKQTAKIRLEYGLPVDSFEIVKGIVKKNNMLGDILSGFSVPMNMVAKIEEKAKGVLDIRRIKAGNAFAFLKHKNPEKKSQYFIYEDTPVEYYIVELNDSVTITKCEKPTVTFHKSVSGVINSSLWNAMQDQQINPLVAIQLSEIFAWSIDFFGLQQGDAFKIMYDEQYVDTVAVGLGEIHGAWFYHGGKEFTAIPFVQEGNIEFFDAEGNSFRKAFLKAPLRFSRISSRFTGRRYHPVLHRHTTHYGVDYAAPSGTPVHAIGDGLIISAGWSGGGGNMVKIRHNSVYSSGYLHLRAYGVGIRSGRYVRQGEIIGYVGSTGLSTGPHLDFRVWRNNSPINPLTMESPSVEPVNPKMMDSFLVIKNTIVMQLSKINLPGKTESSGYTQKDGVIDSSKL
jgi:murein DD-endopeptidase MepM/ murein hydrolase activator NlpD